MDSFVTLTYAEQEHKVIASYSDWVDTKDNDLLILYEPREINPYAGMDDSGKRYNSIKRWFYFNFRVSFKDNASFTSTDIPSYTDVPTGYSNNSNKTEAELVTFYIEVKCEVKCKFSEKNES